MGRARWDYSTKQVEEGTRTILETRNYDSRSKQLQVMSGVPQGCGAQDRARAGPNQTDCMHVQRQRQCRRPLQVVVLVTTWPPREKEPHWHLWRFPCRMGSQWKVCSYLWKEIWGMRVFATQYPVLLTFSNFHSATFIGCRWLCIVYTWNFKPCQTSDELGSRQTRITPNRSQECQATPLSSPNWAPTKPVSSPN